MGCREKCSGHCKNEEPCDYVTGVCFNGCKDGFSGRLCNNCKTLLQSFKCMLDYKTLLNLHIYNCFDNLFWQSISSKEWVSSSQLVLFVARV